MLIDCHTHKSAPYSEGIVCREPGEALSEGQLYSLGIHPWHIPADPSDALAALEMQSAAPGVVALGETGLDTKCATPMWLQIKVFKKHIDLSERLGKPLIIHCVRAGGEISQFRRSLHATMPWIIHGFRGKPTVLRMLLDSGCHISYGERFNPQSLALTPPDRLLAETDESPLAIREIIVALSRERGEDLLPTISANTASLFLRPR